MAATFTLHIFSLRGSAHDRAHWARTLSDDEVRRVSRLTSARLQERFISARAQLRLLLGGLLGQPAAAVELSANRHGRPEVANTPVHFNLSHTDDVAVVAVDDAPIGVDIERAGRVAWPFAGLARLMTADERSWFERMDSDTARREATRCWVRKEAFAKALGTGIASSDLAGTTVWTPGTAPSSDLPVGGWVVGDFRAPAGYVGAVCHTARGRL